MSNDEINNNDQFYKNINWTMSNMIIKIIISSFTTLVLPTDLRGLLFVVLFLNFFIFVFVTYLFMKNLFYWFFVVLSCRIFVSLRYLVSLGHTDLPLTFFHGTEVVR